MGKQAGTAGVIALRRDEKLFMTIPPAEGTDFIHDPDLLQRLWLAGALFQPLYPFRGLDFTKWRKMAFPHFEGARGEWLSGPVAEPQISPLTAIPAPDRGAEPVPPRGVRLPDREAVFGEHIPQLQHVGRPHENRRAAFFEERAHTLAETLVPAVDDLFRARGEFGARAEHPLKIPVEVRMDVAPGVALP